MTLLSTAVPAMPPWWRVSTEIAYFAALAAVIGGAVAYLTVVRPVLRAEVDDPDRQAVHGRTVRLLAWCGPVLLVAGYLQLAARVARGVKGVTFGQSLAPSRIWSFLTLPIAVQNVCYALAGVALLTLFVRDRPTLVTAVALPLTVLGTVVLALPTGQGQTLDTQLNGWFTQVHILGASVWLGGLFALAVIGRGRGFGQRAGLVWARMWQRFSSVALVSVGAVVASGVWLAWRHVGTVGQLFTTTYGRFLLVKLIIVAAMVCAGAYNQLALTPRIARAHAAGDLGRGFALTLRHFPTVVAVETGLGLAVLTIVPFLSGSARTQAGGPPAPAVDGGILALGALLVVTLTASLYASYRVSTLLTRRAAQAC
ncbi:copper resistance D family protein [Kutzneria buriramensis]|nr:CopD family protein [Kutzneria buriramensis]